MASQQHMLTLLANVMVGDWLHITYIPVGRHSACNVKLSDIFKNNKCFFEAAKSFLVYIRISMHITWLLHRP